MRLLAISDKESSTLLNWIKVMDPDLRSLDLIVSCGDLPLSYLEFVSTTLGKDLIYIRGNHDQQVGWSVDRFSGQRAIYQNPVFEERFDVFKNLHAKIFSFKDYFFVGFEGSLWYNGQGPQYHEEEMSKIVQKMERRLRLIQFMRRRIRRARKVVVLTHAPLAGIHDGQDQCHKGFQCFHHFLQSVSPILWIHGHTATESISNNQMTHRLKTAIVNCYEHKFIDLRGEDIRVSFMPSVFKKKARED